jgi:uncharacterized protein
VAEAVWAAGPQYRGMTTSPNERIQALDVLRGFALCGIVFINISQTLGMRELPTGLALFVQARFYVIFSLLFGIGFAIFLGRASARSDRPRVLLVRRFAFLALLGGLHHLLQPGEVLLPYAICGLVFLLPFSYASPLVNLVAGAVLLGAGIMFVGGAGLIPGLFLIGSALASYRVPEELPGRAGLLAGLCGGFVAAALLLWWLSPVIPGGPEIAALEVVQPLLMSGAYMTGVMLLLHTPLRAPLTAVLAPLGRTALTNYLLATVVFVPVGRAIGLEGSARWGAAIALGAGILAAQAVLSPLWLRHFRYGPMEWLWRCVTWWRWMPIRAREVRATT